MSIILVGIFCCCVCLFGMTQRYQIKVYSILLLLTFFVTLFFRYKDINEIALYYVTINTCLMITLIGFMMYNGALWILLEFFTLCILEALHIIILITYNNTLPFNYLQIINNLFVIKVFLILFATTKLGQAWPKAWQPFNIPNEEE